MLKCVKKVCGRKRIGNGVRKGSEWWCENVRMVKTDMHMKCSGRKRMWCLMNHGIKLRELCIMGK